MISEQIMLKVENVSKIYKLGEIGGTTLKEELQRLSAKIRKKEDPTKKIGAKNYNKGEKFKALNNVSLEVKKGERIGIIGHNGAGKSTLLKLISRVTGPTEGSIYLNGRVASMLEVGTGFHPELTGRENVYMNGAILGMTKAEIDEKMNDIIEFSEVREFIDTPVKRYSSGMYVKLAFSVAAHLDSEIVIMDEVLAVGDVAFQNKCLKKMNSLSDEQDRTILYVSHNMDTIRKLCTRVIVLNEGKIIFDGDVESGISKYLGAKTMEIHNVFDEKCHAKWKRKEINIKELNLLNKSKQNYSVGDNIVGNIIIESSSFFENVKVRFEINSPGGRAVGTCFSNYLNINVGTNTIDFCFGSSYFTPGVYFINVVVYESDNTGKQAGLDGVYPGLILIFDDTINDANSLNWRHNDWGFIHLPNFNVVNSEKDSNK